MFSGKEAGLTEIHKLRTQLDESSKKIGALRVQKSRILGQIGNRLVDSGGFDPWHLLNDQIGVLVGEKMGYAAALEHPRSEHLNVLDDVKRLLDQTLLRGRGDEC